ncbi:hypothetical protein E1B28_008628 [Marasmius oreades]|uniref:Uncharacterized protein n=1 Tax=Marasmius oreades TaxID=181124 RepID=A0A9P7RYW4_9AGAR|nr:uncharacterized protein E1B28_008628 [Marasmius oreades]KAG7092264.1 hypothetical protein E1B28_008628 [Marasmius oreades]
MRSNNNNSRLDLPTCQCSIVPAAMMGLKSKKSRPSQSSSSSLASSATGSFSVVSRRGLNNPSSSTLFLPSATQDFDQPKRSQEKEKDKSMTKLSGFFSSSRKGKEKTAVQSMEPKTGVMVLETMSSPATSLTTVLKSASPSSESSSQGRAIKSVESTAADNPRQPLFVANPDPSPLTQELSPGEPLSFSASECSSSSASGYTSQTSYTESDHGPTKKEKDPSILTYDPSTATQLTRSLSNGALLNLVPLHHPEEDPPAYTLLPQAQPQKNVTSSDPRSESSDLPVRLRPAKTLSKPAPLRHISVPVLPTQDRPPLPSRAVSVPDAELVTQNGGVMVGYGLDRIDELDETSPYGVNLHVGGPFDAASTDANGKSSSKRSDLQPGFFDPVATISYTPFGIPKGGLQVGQVIPRNPSSQPQHIEHQRHPSYTNHHLQPAGTSLKQNRMSSLSFMSALPSPGWPLPSPGFPDPGPEDHYLATSNTPVVGEKSFSQIQAGLFISSTSSTASTRPAHIAEASSSSTMSSGSSHHTAPHDKPSNQWSTYTSPSNHAFSSNPQTPRTPSSANWSTTAYGGIDNVHRGNVRHSQIGLALGSPLPESSLNDHGHEGTSSGEMLHIAEEHEGKDEGGVEGIGMAILKEGSSDDEAQSAAVPTQIKTAAADERAWKSSEIRDEDYEYWTGSSGSNAIKHHKQLIGYESTPTWASEFQCHSPYSLLDDKDAVESYGGPLVNGASSSQQAHHPCEGTGHDREASSRTLNGTSTRGSSLLPDAVAHIRAASSQSALGSHLPHLRSHPSGYSIPPQQRQKLYVPNSHSPPTLSIPPQSRSLQSSPTGSPYHSDSHSPNRTPGSVYPHTIQAQYQDSSQLVSASPNKHYSLPSPASPNWVSREAWTGQGVYGPITAPQNIPYHPHRHTNGVKGNRTPSGTGVNGHPNGSSHHHRDPTSSTSRAMFLPPGAAAPNPNPYERQTPSPSTRFNPPSPRNSDIPPVPLNRPRHAPTKLVMPTPLQGHGPPQHPRSPYHANSLSSAQKYPPPPPIPPTPNGSAGKVLRKRSSMANTTFGPTHTNGGDEWGYVSNSGGYVSEDGVGRSKTMQVKKAPKRVLSKRRADL